MRLSDVELSREAPSLRLGSGAGYIVAAPDADAALTSPEQDKSDCTQSPTCSAGLAESFGVPPQGDRAGPGQG